MPEPTIMLVADCNLDEIMNPISKKPMRKEHFGFIVVIVDFGVVIACMIFTWWLEKAQESYVKYFKDRCIEMDDFAIRVKKIPHESKYSSGETTYDDDIIRGLLMHHFDKIIKD